MDKRRVLIVEDEQDVAGLIKHAIERSGDAETEIVGSGDTALKAVAERRPDLVLLDISLPVLDGFEVCRILRSRTETRQVPIIILTARAAEDDRVGGLELGADDYITKPFSLRELTARVRAVLRRATVKAETATRVYRGVGGDHVQLTAKEFLLLQYLVQNKNRVVSRDRLLERVWGYERVIETRSVDVHVGRLRSKLGPAGQQVETVVGLGYRFVDSIT